MAFPAVVAILVVQVHAVTELMLQPLWGKAFLLHREALTAAPVVVAAVPVAEAGADGSL